MADYNLVGRIRPVYKGVWNAETAYTVLETVMSTNGHAVYIAVKDVPAGTALTNEEYWGILLDASTVFEAADEIKDVRDEVDNQLTGFNTALSTKIDGAYVDENGRLCLTANNEVVAGPFEVAGGGGGGGSSNNAVLTLTNTTGWLSKAVSVGSDCVVTANWSSVEGDIPTGNGVLKIIVNGTVKHTANVQQGAIEHNLKPYITAGSNIVKLSITDVYGNSRTINFSINGVSLVLESAFDATPAFAGPIQFVYTPIGNVEKTVHIVLDGTEIHTATVTASGREQTFTIPAQSHGSHTLRVWFEATVDGETVPSNELYYDLNCIVAGNNTVNIMSAFRQDTAEQYDLLAIEHQVYDPANLTAAVTYWANGAKVAEGTVDRTVHTWNYRPTDIGALHLEIRCGDTVKPFDLIVTEASVQIEAETQNLQLFLTSEGRSNIEDNPGTWAYGGISATFTGFNWISDGWKQDAEKNTVLRVSGDARVEIPMQIFATDFRSTGKTIEVEFASRDVLDYNAMILSCFSGERGIEITAQRADMTSEQSTIGTQYKEDEHVRLTFVTEKRSGNRLILIYLNGIICIFIHIYILVQLFFADRSITGKDQIIRIINQIPSIFGKILSNLFIRSSLQCRYIGVGSHTMLCCHSNHILHIAVLF